MEATCAQNGRRRVWNVVVARYTNGRADAGLARVLVARGIATVVTDTGHAEGHVLRQRGRITRSIHEHQLRVAHHIGANV